MDDECELNFLFLLIAERFSATITSLHHRIFHGFIHCALAPHMIKFALFRQIHPKLGIAEKDEESAIRFKSQSSSSRDYK